MDLAADRYLNLIYYAIITDFTQTCILADPDEFTKVIATVDRSLENTISAETGAPAWWHGDEDAYQSGIAAARALGVG